MADATNTGSVTLTVSQTRGMSAYEVAVAEGYTGTQTQWLQSLKGEDGDDAQTVTVNGKSASGGNITIRGTDIQVQAGVDKTVAQALAEKADSVTPVNNLTTSNAALPLSANQGVVLSGMIATVTQQVSAKAQTALYTVELPASGWSAAAPYTQTVTAAGLLATDYPLVDFDRSEATASTISALKEAFQCIDRIATGENSLTATALSTCPAQDLTLYVKVVR